VKNLDYAFWTELVLNGCYQMCVRHLAVWCRWLEGLVVTLVLALGLE